MIIHWNNIEPGREHNFERYVDRGFNGQDVGPYNFDSIMHYPSFGFSHNGMPTITRLDGSTFDWQRDGLSETDIQAVESLYPDICGDGVVNPEDGEQCDDANLDELDGCRSNCLLGPSDLRVDHSVAYLLPVEGGGGGGAFHDNCPDGQVITGIVGRSGIYVDRVQVQCSTLGLSSGEQGSINVDIEPGTLMETHGGGGGSPFSLSCGPGQAVVGFGGRSGKYLDRLFLRCASVTLVDDWETASVVIGFGETADTNSVGGGGGGSFLNDCPPGMVVATAKGRSGTYVDALGFNCHPLELL